MREIKFRVWDKNSKTMYSSEVIDTINFYDGTVTCSSGGYNEIEWNCDVDNSVLMQYTGFKDGVEGIEIYEGDILEANFIFEEVDGSSYLETVNAKVYFNETKGAWEVEEVNGETDPLGDWISNGNAKVVGNIFEATEAVEEKATCSRKEQV